MPSRNRSGASGAPLQSQAVLRFRFRAARTWKERPYHSVLERHTERAAESRAPQCVGRRGARDAVVIALLAQVREHDVREVTVHEVARELGARTVGQVTRA